MQCPQRSTRYLVSLSLDHPHHGSLRKSFEPRTRQLHDDGTPDPEQRIPRLQSPIALLVPIQIPSHTLSKTTDRDMQGLSKWGALHQTCPSHKHGYEGRHEASILSRQQPENNEPIIPSTPSPSCAGKFNKVTYRFDHVSFRFQLG